MLDGLAMKDEEAQQADQTVSELASGPRRRCRCTCHDPRLHILHGDCGQLDNIVSELGREHGLKVAQVPLAGGVRESALLVEVLVEAREQVVERGLRQRDRGRRSAATVIAEHREDVRSDADEIPVDASARASARQTRR